MTCSNNITPCGCGNNPCGCGTSSNDVVYQGPNLSCTGVSNCDTVTEAIETIDGFICGPGMVETIINNIINNINLYNQFTSIVNNTVDCQTVWNCYNSSTTTTTTTTGGPVTIYTYVTTCNSYTWDVTGDTYFDSDEYSYTEGNVTNILYLTICSGTGAQIETQTISAPSPYIWPINGLSYTASGTFSYGGIGPCADGGATCTYYLELTIIDPTTTTTTTI